VDYQFRDPVYAIAFAKLNGTVAHATAYLAKAQAEVDEMVRRDCEKYDRIVREEESRERDSRP
jgi:hypothetical protein